MSASTYDLTTDVGKVRLLIEDWDVSSCSGPRDTWSCVFTDEEIQVFIDDEGELKLAAAAALASIANSAARLASRKRIGDYDEDLTGLAKELRAQAADYRAQVAEAPADAIAEMAVDDFTAREIIENVAEREL